MKVEFVLRPGVYKLAYFPGEEGDFSPEFAKELVEKGYAKYTEEAFEEKEIEMAVREVQKETAVRKGKSKRG